MYKCMYEQRTNYYPNEFWQYVMKRTTTEHHKRYEYCKTRPAYRQGRELKAVKVYTVANESKHLLVFGVPKVNLCKEIKCKLEYFGELLSCRCVTEDMSTKIELEPFTDVFAVHFEKLEKARLAKRRLDAIQFYGGTLHISYAPEKETLEELREKVQQRREEIANRIRRNLLEERKLNANSTYVSRP